MLPETRHAGGLYDLVMEYPLRHGKGLRPGLCLATCRAFGGSANDALPTAAVLELYHNAFLIHDDVEDGSEQRRNETTLHMKYGVPIAVNVGDGILALCMQPLLNNMQRIGLGRAIRILDVISRMTRESAEGQNLELDWIFRQQEFPTRKDYIRIVYKKTCWYSFIAPIETGAIAAGADTACLSILRRFALHLGVAFQIKDDVLNIDANEAAYGKEANGDLWEGKYSLMLIHALSCASAEERVRARAILHKYRPQNNAAAELVIASLVAANLLDKADSNKALRVLQQQQDKQFKTAADVLFLRQLIENYSAIAYANAVAARHLRRAWQYWHSAGKFLPDSTHKDFLETLLHYTIERER